MDAAAYVNWGRWVADCPRWPDCACSLAVEPGQGQAFCPDPPNGCGLAYTVIWPADAAGLMTALAGRPAEGTRNWYPAGHPRALAYGLPAGETPAELDAETAAHAVEDHRDGVLAALASAGLQLASDGTIEGL